MDQKTQKDMNLLVEEVSARNTNKFESVEQAKSQIGNLFATNWKSQNYKIPYVVLIESVEYSNQKHWLNTKLLGINKPQELALDYPLIPISKEEGERFVDFIRNYGQAIANAPVKPRVKRKPAPSIESIVNPEKLATTAEEYKQNIPKTPSEKVKVKQPVTNQEPKVYDTIVDSLMAGRTRDETVKYVFEVHIDKVQDSDEGRRIKRLCSVVYAPSQRPKIMASRMKLAQSVESKGVIDAVSPQTDKVPQLK